MTIKVLLIENDESCIEDVNKFLADDPESFEVDLAPSLQSGLKKLENCAGYDDPLYNIIVLDLTLPNGNGIDLFSKVIEVCKRLPIVVISRFEDEALECVKAGAQDYIIRPIHLLSLPKSLRYAIERFSLDRRYVQLVESTQAAIYEVNFVTSRFTYVNDKTCQYSGYTKRELLQMSPFDILTDEAKLLFQSRIKKLMEGEFINNVEEFQIITKDGRKKWALISADYIIKDNVAVGARVVALDITNKKKKQQLIQTIFDSSPVALGTLDFADGERILKQVNRFMCNLLGYSKEELVGNGAAMLYPSREEFIRVGKIKYKRIVQGKRGTVETQWMTKDGVILDILLSTAPLDSNDPYSYSTFTAVDVTEDKKTDRILNDKLKVRVNEWQNEYRTRILADNQMSLLDTIIEGYK